MDQGSARSPGCVNTTGPSAVRILAGRHGAHPPTDLGPNVKHRINATLGRAAVYPAGHPIAK